MIALGEWPDLSSRAIAEMCGVGDQLVRAVRPDEQVRESRTLSRTGQDGKRYPATRAPRVVEDDDGVDDDDFSGEEDERGESDQKQKGQDVGNSVATLVF